MAVKIGPGGPRKQSGTETVVPVSIITSGGVPVDSFGGSGGTAAADESSFTAGTTPGTALMGATTADTVAADKIGVLAMTADRELKVSVTSGGTAGTQYTEGDTDSSITGTAMMWEDGSDTLRAVSAAKPLPISDAGGNISIDDGGNVITVDGTVAVTHAALTELAAAINADRVDVNVAASVLPSGAATAAKQDTEIAFLAALETLLTSLETIDAATRNAVQVMDDWDETNRAAVNTIAGQVGVQGASGTVNALTQRVVLATDVALPAGTNAIGKLAANSGVDIGDVDVTSLPALPAGSNNIGDVDVLTVPRSLMGPGQPGTAVDSYTHAAINISAGNNTVLVSSAANKQIWVYGIGFTLSVAGTASFQDEDDTAITGIMPFEAKSGLAIAPSGNFSMPIWKLATDKDLEIDLVTADLDGWIDYAILSV